MPAFFSSAWNPASLPPFLEELRVFPGVLTPTVLLLTNEMEEARFHCPQNVQRWLQVSF